MNSSLRRKANRLSSRFSERSEMSESLPEFLKHRLDQFQVRLIFLSFMVFYITLWNSSLRHMRCSKTLQLGHNLDPRMQLFDVFTSLPHWSNPMAVLLRAQKSHSWNQRKGVFHMDGLFTITAKIKTPAPSCKCACPVADFQECRTSQKARIWEARHKDWCKDCRFVDLISGACFGKEKCITSKELRG